MKILRSNPTGAELDTLIEAHARIGYLAGVAEGEYDLAYAIRKNEEANAFKRLVSGEERVSASAAERLAELEVWELKQAEIEAKTKSTKINNLYRSVGEAINGVKFLGRLAG